MNKTQTCTGERCAFRMGKDMCRNILTTITNDLLKPQRQQASKERALTNQILTHLNTGDLKKAVRILFSSPLPFPSHVYSRLFQACSSRSAIIEARKLEFHLISFWKPAVPVFLLNRAIGAYGKCKHPDDAEQLFDEMPERDGGSWNAIITAYSQNQRHENALLLFKKMNGMGGVRGNEITFASVLGSCAALLEMFLARQVHGIIVKCGLCWNVVLGSSLVDIYGKCWVMDDARRMFDEITTPNDVSWNVIVRRYLDVGDDREALLMFFKSLTANNVSLLTFTFSNALIACSNISALTEGTQIHGVAVKLNFVKDMVVINSFIAMYARCEALQDARRVFDQPGARDVVSWTSIISGYAACGRTKEARELFNGMPGRNVVSWNAMLVGYTRFFQWEEALEFLFWMRTETSDIDYVTLSLILNVSAGLSDVQLGKQVHGFVYRHGFYTKTLVANALLDMYSKCGSLKSLRVWFFEMAHLRDRVSWNALITCYSRRRLSEEVMPMFTQMLQETTPGEFDFSTLLAACANIFTLQQGKEIHGYMLRNGYELDVVIRAALVDMYSKCRCLKYAIKVFKETASSDLIMWNSIMLGCAHNGKGQLVLDLFQVMQEQGIQYDNVTFQGILLACIVEGFVDLGKQYFDSMSKEHCVIPRLDHYECMIELYSRYGYMDELDNFVQKMPFEPTEPMVNRIFDACREHSHPKLGTWAAQRLNEFH